MYIVAVSEKLGYNMFIFAYIKVVNTLIVIYIMG